MIYSLGIDIIQTDRVKKALETWGGKFADKILGEEEMEIFSAKFNKVQFLAGRFAAKEAVAKALGRSLAWREVEILRDSGAPHPILHGRAKAIAAGGRLQISLSHSGDYAIACALFVSG